MAVFSRSSIARLGMSVVALAGVSVLSAACGGGGSAPGVASLGSTTTTSAAATGGTPEPFAGPQKEYQYQLTYAQCMRAHGLPDFPDPVLTSHSLSFNPTADSHSPQYSSANDDCKHLLPDNGGPPTAAQLAALTQRMLKYTNCMRAHGVPNFPDPTVSANNIGFRIDIDKNSPQLHHAQSACRSDLPGGGP